MPLRRLIIGLLSSAAVVTLAAPVSADPPGRVGRVADVEGGVSMLPPGAGDWSWASRNFPVTPGESFWTGDDGRAQLQIGAADARLDSQTELDVLDLDYGQMRLALPQGSLEVRLWTSTRGGVTIATPAGDVRLDIPGLYRIDVGAPPNDGTYPPVEITVFDGQAGAPSPEGLAPVYAGQAAVLYAGYDPQVQDAQDASIDDWGYQLEAAAPWRPEDDAMAGMTGLDDLDAAGDYVMDPVYGRVWFPRAIPYGWAPYRYGRWAYVEPWGYTWIDDQPWGFAPFHYGRWTQIRGRWAWAPGNPNREPVYAPALVAFLGGDGWRLGGSDAVGWVPLGPDEVYHPSYRVSDDTWRRLNAGSVRPMVFNGVAAGGDRMGGVMPGGYRNAQAATVVRAAAFTGGQPVGRSVVPVSADVIAHAPPATLANRPPPSALARAGVASPLGGGGRFAPPMAARPPADLAAVRGAVVAPPRAGSAPPVIPGARLTPAPRFPPGGRGSPPMVIAPAQMRRPSPVAGPGAGPRTGPGSMLRPRPGAMPEGAPPISPPAPRFQAAPPMSEVAPPPRTVQDRPFRPQPGQPPVLAPTPSREEAPRVPPQRPGAPRPEFQRPDVQRPDLARPAPPRIESPRIQMAPPPVARPAAPRPDPDEKKLDRPGVHPPS